jgi:hypothetical protein
VLRASPDDIGDGAEALQFTAPITWMDKLGLADQEKSSDDAQVFPLFPLGSVVYLPTTQHILSIFEPRYRQLYNDILLSGGG